MLSTTQLHEKILQYINEKRSVKTIDEIFDHLAEFEVSRVDIDSALKSLKISWYIHGMVISTGGIIILPSIKLKLAGIAELRAPQQQNNSITVNGDVHGSTLTNTWINNGTIHNTISSNTEALKLFEELFVTMRHENIANHEVLIATLQTAIQENNKPSILSTFNKIAVHCWNALIIIQFISEIKNMLWF